MYREVILADCPFKKPIIWILYLPQSVQAVDFLGGSELWNASFPRRTFPSLHPSRWRLEWWEQSRTFPLIPNYSDSLIAAIPVDRGSVRLKGPVTRSKDCLVRLFGPVWPEQV